jgi:hypothetical protein
MTTTAETVLAALHRFTLRAEGNGRYRCNSPLRPGSNSHGFTLKIDPDGEHGTWHDHVSGESGSLYQLATLLGIELPQTKPDTHQKRTYHNLDEYAAEHGVPSDVFRAAGWKETRYAGQPALAFETPAGMRYRFLTGTESVYRSQSGYQRCWYGLARAVKLATDTHSPLVICNGERSVVVAQYYGIPATCITAGEKAEMPASLLNELRAAWNGAILLALDCDTTGRKVSMGLSKQLTAAGYDVQAKDLNGGKGFDLADFAHLHRDVGSMAALEACAAIDPSPTEPPPNAPRFIIRPESWLDTLPDPEWLVEGEVLARAYQMIYGAAGCGKTFIAINRALRVATAGYRVLYIATEDLSGIRQKVRAWRRHHRTMEGYFTILDMPDGLDLADHRHVSELIDTISPENYHYIVVDTLREAHTGDENSSGDTSRVNRAIQRIIRATGTTIEVVHHTGVADGRERGSTALSGNLDLKWKVSNDDGTIVMTCEKYRYGPALEKRYLTLLPRDDGSAVVVPNTRRKDPTAALTRAQKDILEFLSQSIFDECGARTKQIEEGTGHKGGTLYRSLSTLKDRGYVSQGVKGDPTG